MRNETTPDPVVNDRLAQLRRAEVEYLEAYRARREVSRDDDEARQDAELDLREARHALRDSADDAVRSLARGTGGQVHETADRGLVAELETRTVWYDLTRDVSRPTWLGRDGDAGDARLDSNEVWHWLTAAAPEH